MIIPSDFMQYKCGKCPRNYKDQLKFVKHLATHGDTYPTATTTTALPTPAPKPFEREYNELKDKYEALYKHYQSIENELKQLSDQESDQTSQKANEGEDGQRSQPESSKTDDGVQQQEATTTTTATTTTATEVRILEESSDESDDDCECDECRELRGMPTGPTRANLTEHPEFPHGNVTSGAGSPVEMPISTAPVPHGYNASLDQRHPNLENANVSNHSVIESIQQPDLKSVEQFTLTSDSAELIRAKRRKREINAANALKRRLLRRKDTSKDPKKSQEMKERALRIRLKQEKKQREHIMLLQQARYGIPIAPTVQPSGLPDIEKRDNHPPMRCFVALALLNSSFGILPVWEIYRFMLLNFTYYRKRRRDWKNTVRLSLIKRGDANLFRRVSLPEQLQRKNGSVGAAWRINDNMSDLYAVFSSISKFIPEDFVDPGLMSSITKGFFSIGDYRQRVNEIEARWSDPEKAPTDVVQVEWWPEGIPWVPGKGVEVPLAVCERAPCKPKSK